MTTLEIYKNLIALIAVVFCADVTYLCFFLHFSYFLFTVRKGDITTTTSKYLLRESTAVLLVFRSELYT